MNRLELINKLKQEISKLVSASWEHEVAIARESDYLANEVLISQGARIARAIISKRKTLAQLQMDEGVFIDRSVPSRIGGQQD